MGSGRLEQFESDEATKDALRLSERQQRALLAYLDNQCNDMIDLDEQRVDQRFDFSSSAVLVRIGQPGGTSGTFIVRPRNLSRTGMGFLHGSFCYPGSPCEVLLPTCEDERAALSGRVIRCRHVRANVHELGMQFAQPIELGRFVQAAIHSGAEEGRASQPLPRLTGRCLLIDPSTDSRELFDFLAAHMGLASVTTLDGSAAKVLLGHQTFDIILVDHDLATVMQPTLVGELREAGFHGPVVSLTLPDRLDGPNDSVGGFDGHVLKPLTCERLLEGLSTHLSRDWTSRRSTTPLFSEHWSKKAMQPLILGHLERLEHRVADVHKAMRESEMSAAGAVLREIAGASGGFGFPQISAAAMELARALESSAGIEGCRERFDELADLCAAACQVRRRRL